MAAVEPARLYDEHIRSLPVEQRLQLLALIAGDLAVEGAPTEHEARHSLAELYGIGQGVWEGVDAQEYVNRLRGEWEERPFGKLDRTIGRE